MGLLKGNEIVEDKWSHTADEEDPVKVENPIVTLESWKIHGEMLERSNTPLGILLKSDQSPVQISDVIGRFQVIAIDFPKVSDGRGFSYARLLRERYGYEGEIRAVGEVRRDQYQFLLRCGFDAFEIHDTKDVSGWKEAAEEVSVFYQPSADGTPWALRQRHS